MFSKGLIIYFTPFYFKNGRPPKNKYFVVLKVIGSTSIVASLPTSIDKIPSFIIQEHGCINDDERGVNCYLFEGRQSVCTNGFCFPVHTYVHGFEVENYSIESFEIDSKVEDTDYEIKGTLTHSEMQYLIECIIQSGSTKNRIKKLLIIQD